jgi:hypothetical protein
MLSMKIKKLLDKVFSDTTEFMIRVIFGFIVGISLLSVMFSQEPTEIIGYRVVPSMNSSYGCWMDLEIVSLPNGVERGSDEEEKIYQFIVKKEIGEIGWNQQYLILNNEQYVLVKIQVPTPFNIELNRELSRDWDEDLE